jgi:hypothetical protein
VIATIKRGQRVAGLLKYLDKPDGTLLMTNLQGSHPQHFAQQFREVESLRERPPAKPVVHIPFRAAPGEDLTDEEWRDAAELAIREMGFGNSPYVVYLHEHPGGRHLHIATYRVQWDGRVVSDSNDRYRVMKVSRALEERFGLVNADRVRVRSLSRRALEKALQQPDLEDRLGALREVIDLAASSSGDLRQFLSELRKAGVTAHLKVARNTGALQGISFGLENGEIIKGSALGRNYSLARLMNRHELQANLLPGEGNAVGLALVSRAEVDRLRSDHLAPDLLIPEGARFNALWHLPDDSKVHRSFSDLLATRLPHRRVFFAERTDLGDVPATELQRRTDMAQVFDALGVDSVAPPLPHHLLERAANRVRPPEPPFELLAELQTVARARSLTPADPDLVRREARLSISLALHEQAHETTAQLDRLFAPTREELPPSISSTLDRYSTVVDLIEGLAGPDLPSAWTREELAVLIDTAASLASSRDSLGGLLEAVGVDVRFHHAPDDSIRGIAFRSSSSSEWLAGSTLSPAHSLPALQRRYPRIAASQAPAAGVAKRSAAPPAAGAEHARQSLGSPSSAPARKLPTPLSGSSTPPAPSRFRSYSQVGLRLLSRDLNPDLWARRVLRLLARQSGPGRAAVRFSSRNQALSFLASKVPGGALLRQPAFLALDSVRRSAFLFLELRAAADKPHPRPASLLHGDFSSDALRSSLPRDVRVLPPPAAPSFKEAVTQNRRAERLLRRAFAAYRASGGRDLVALQKAAITTLQSRQAATEAALRALGVPRLRDLVAVYGNANGRAVTAWVTASRAAGLSARVASSVLREVGPLVLSSALGGVVSAVASLVVRWTFSQIGRFVFQNLSERRQEQQRGRS